MNQSTVFERTCLLIEFSLVSPLKNRPIYNYVALNGSIIHQKKKTSNNTPSINIHIVQLPVVEIYMRKPLRLFQLYQ